MSSLIHVFLVLCLFLGFNEGKGEEVTEIKWWIERLGEGPPGDNNEATEALIKIGKPVIPYLLELLEKEPPRSSTRALSREQWARLRAAHCLSVLGYPEIVLLLLREIRREPHPIARLIYAIYLTRHDVGKAVEALVEELKRGEYTLPDIVITLKNIRSPKAIPLLRPLLKDPRADVRLGAAEVLVTLGDTKAEQVLLEQLGGDEELRAALLLPKKYREKILPILRKHIDHPDARMRLRVAEKLAKLGDASGFEILLDALQTEPAPHRRGGDGELFEQPGIVDRVIALIGRPDAYDPFGTKALRDAVISRWRRRWKAEGQRFLQGLHKRKPLPGRQEVRFGNIRLSKEMQDMRTFFYLAGKKLYEIGAMDGSFPPVGRLLGDQSGIWAHPIKVMDGFEFTVSEEGRVPWTLTDCRNFVHRFASCEFRFARNGLYITQRDFVAEDEPALFSQLILHNETDRRRTLNLRFSGWVNIRPSWRSGLKNDLDILTYQDGLISAVDSGTERWCVVFGADRPPHEHELEDNRANLTYPLTLPPHGRTTLTFLILAEHEEGVESAKGKFQSLLKRADEILAEKEALYRREILSGIRFRCSDDDVTKAFYCAKANLVMMSADLRPYFVAPYLFAGIPLYTQLLGCDICYSIPGATAGGFNEIARSSLECLAYYAQQRSGWVPHEVCTNGRLIGPGNAQETPQFVIACWKYLQWTGDKGFLEKVYPLCKRGIEFALKRFDKDGDGYLEGPAMVEAADMGPEKLDSACYLYGAFQALARIAESLGRRGEADGYRKRASELRRRFNADWWNAEEGMWADSLNADGTQRLDGYWTVAVPMETGIADGEKAYAALSRIEKGWVNEWGFVHTRRTDITGEFPFVFANDLLAIAAFKYGDPDLGWRMLKLAARAPLEFGMLGAFDEAIPRSANFIQLWSSARFLEGVIEGLAGIEPRAAGHRVRLFPQLPRGLSEFALQNVLIGEHRLDLSCRQEGNRETITVVHQDGPCPLKCSAQILWGEGRRITVDGRRRITPRKAIQTPPGREVVIVDCDVRPGDSLTIHVERSASSLGGRRK